MKESALHNMSAPPRSKIIVAPNRKAIPQLRFRLHEFPTKGAHYAHRLAEMYNFPNLNALLDFDASLMNTLQITPILSTMKFNDNTIQVNTPLINLFVLSRTSGTLFMIRRTPEYTHARMSKKLFLPLHGFEHHFDGETLCLP